LLLSLYVSSSPVEAGQRRPSSDGDETVSAGFTAAAAAAAAGTFKLSSNVSREYIIPSHPIPFLGQVGSDRLGQIGPPKPRVTLTKFTTFAACVSDMEPGHWVAGSQNVTQFHLWCVSDSFTEMQLFARCSLRLVLRHKDLTTVASCPLVTYHIYINVVIHVSSFIHQKSRYSRTHQNTAGKYISQMDHFYDYQIVIPFHSTYTTCFRFLSTY